MIADLFRMKEPEVSKTRQIVCTCTTETACCVALQTEPIDESVSADLSAGFKALGDPHRVAVICPPRPDRCVWSISNATFRSANPR